MGNFLVMMHASLIKEPSLSWAATSRNWRLKMKNQENKVFKEQLNTPIAIDDQSQVSTFTGETKYL
jgi:hypothetical protein